MLHVITIVLQLLANTEILARGILVVVAGDYFWHLVELDAHLSEHISEQYFFPVIPFLSEQHHHEIEKS